MNICKKGRKAFLNKIFNISNQDDYNFILAHIRCDYSMVKFIFKKTTRMEK
ncbi:MAG: hypothetical protein U9N77_13470 [Thermodesulfobacteriota bacterium]|nr:hypothetical protein [Thermodesulfobacteriota bacterium]